jgi:serine/threonine protein kinase
VQVLDFGIAKVGWATRNKRETRVGAVMGTPYYMSPEQSLNAASVTPRSDVYSLGATLYELATLRMAFDAETEVGIYRKKAMAEFEPAEAVNPGLDRSLAQAINRALNPIPAARFASCEEFAAALA